MTSKKTKEDLPLGLWFFCFFCGWGLISSIVTLFSEDYFAFRFIYSAVQISLQIITLVLICQQKKSFRIPFWSAFLINALVYCLVAYVDPNMGIELIYKLIFSLFWGAYFQYSKKIRAWGTSPTESSSPASTCQLDPSPMLAMAKSGSDLPSEAVPLLEISPPANEAIEPQSENTSPVINAIEPPPENSSPAMKTTNLPPEKQTHQFCKLCGGALDAFKKCTGCGKQYFHINKIRWLKVYAVIVTILFVGVSSLSVHNYYVAVSETNKKNELSERASFLQYYEEQLAEIQKIVDTSPVRNMPLFDTEGLIYDFTKAKMVESQYSTYSKLSLPQKIEQIINEYVNQTDLTEKALDDLAYLSKAAVFVTETGQKYHKFSCYHISGKSYWIYNVEAAKDKGYTACADCWK